MTISRSKARKQPTFLSLSAPTRGRLASHGITSLTELSNCTWLELHTLTGCGLKTTSECDELMKARGLVYKTVEPKDAFTDIFEMLTAEYSIISDFGALGEKYGLSRALMYELYSALERAVKANDRAKQAHSRWKQQVIEEEI